MHLSPETNFELINELPYLAASPGGRGTSYLNLPILRARVPGLPPELSGLLITSDLQGIAPLSSHHGATHLLGEVLVEHFEELAASGLVPDPRDLGVLIAGDM